MLATDDRLHWLRWIAILVPPCALLVIEIVNRQLFGEPGAGALATLIACGVALAVAYIVARLAFGALDDARARTVARAREVEALDALVRERERLSRELHDGTAQLLGYVLMRTETLRTWYPVSPASMRAYEARRSGATGLLILPGLSTRTPATVRSSGQCVCPTHTRSACASWTSAPSSASDRVG